MTEPVAETPVKKQEATVSENLSEIITDDQSEKNTIVIDMREEEPSVKASVKGEEKPVKEKKKRAKRIYKVKPITACQHTDRPHYSKGMCKACYNYRGRQTMATACEHTDRIAYAFGFCSKCYNNSRYVPKEDNSEAK